MFQSSFETDRSSFQDTSSIITEPIVKPSEVCDTAPVTTKSNTVQAPTPITNSNNLIPGQAWSNTMNTGGKPGVRSDRGFDLWKMAELLGSACHQINSDFSTVKSTPRRPG